MERNIALKLMYVGTAYHGWQVQKNAVSVAETLERPLHGGVPPVKCTGAGRTDAGVHAEVYIANFLQEVALLTDSDEENDDDNDASSNERVSLMTIHASKGLEFNSVFVVGLEENIFRVRVLVRRFVSWRRSAVCSMSL